MTWKEKMRDSVSAEKQKLAAMSGKDRIWYIWAYYKFHIAGLFILLFLLIGAVTVIYRSTFRTELYCYYLNVGAVEDIDTKPLTRDFADYMQFGKKQLVAAEAGNATFDDSTSEMGYGTLMKVTALAASKDLDVIIGDASAMEYYATQNGLSDLSELLPDDLYQSLTVAGHIYDSYNFVGDWDKHACAVTITDSLFALDSGLTHAPSADIYLGVISNSRRKDTAVSLIKYIVEAP